MTGPVTLPDVEYPLVAVCLVCDHYAETWTRVTAETPPHEEWIHVEPCGHLVDEIHPYAGLPPEIQTAASVAAAAAPVGEQRQVDTSGTPEAPTAILSAPGLSSEAVA